MICLNCKKQIQDDAQRCPFCGEEVIHERQVKKEISFRRQQRWIFYGIISAVFLAMLIIIIMIYRTNSQLLLNMADVEADLENKEKVLEQAHADLIQRAELIQNMEIELNEKKAENDDLKIKTDDFKAKFEENVAKVQELTGTSQELNQEVETCQSSLNLADANVYGLIVRLGQGMTNENLARIPLADANLEGQDTDEDGLSDLIEDAFGTSKGHVDTDGDGYGDKEELLGGFNPNGEGSLGIDYEFANMYKGKILLQVESHGEAWYVAGDGKKYFLGNPADAFGAMRGLEYWTAEWSKNNTDTSTNNEIEIVDEGEEIRDEGEVIMDGSGLMIPEF